MTLSFPVSTRDLTAFLPHRDPFVWITEVTSITERTDGPAGTCRVRLSPGAGYCGPGGVRASSVIEWIAQAYGFVKACHHLEKGGAHGEPSRAFLVGVTDCEIDLAGVERQSSLLVEVREMRALHPAYLLEGSVKSEDGSREFARARLKVFAAD